MQNNIEQEPNIFRLEKEKFCFIGLSIGSAGSVESGVSVVDRNLNLIKTDKAYNMSEIKMLVANLSPPENAILCIDLPQNIMMLTGKWRIESKQTQVLTKHSAELGKKDLWKKRFSDRGSELCRLFSESGMTVYRYNSTFTKNMLKLTPPFKSRSPAACKFLQNIIEEKLHIKDMPANLLPLPSLNSLVGAYVAWKIWAGEAEKDFRQIGEHKNTPVVSALTL